MMNMMVSANIMFMFNVFCMNYTVAHFFLIGNPAVDVLFNHHTQLSRTPQSSNDLKQQKIISSTKKKKKKKWL